MSFFNDILGNPIKTSTPAPKDIPVKKPEEKPETPKDSEPDTELIEALTGKKASEESSEAVVKKTVTVAFPVRDVINAVPPGTLAQKIHESEKASEIFSSFIKESWENDNDESLRKVFDEEDRKALLRLFLTETLEEEDEETIRYVAKSLFTNKTGRALLIDEATANNTNT